MHSKKMISQFEYQTFNPQIEIKGLAIKRLTLQIKH